MSNVTVRHTEQVARRHNVGRETFYVDIVRRAELSPDLLEIRKSEVEHVLIYLGDGAGDGGTRESGHNQVVGITVEMAKWLLGALEQALQEELQTRVAMERHDEEADA